MPESRSMCSVKDCEKPKHARDLCEMHKRRRRVLGAPLVNSLHVETDCRIRLIDEHASHHGDGCLIWPFAAGDRKRGVLTYRGALRPYTVFASASSSLGRWKPTTVAGRATGAIG